MMRKYTKRIGTLLLATAMMLSQFTVSAKANSFELDFLRPTTGVVSAKEPFSIQAETADKTTFYTADNVRYYTQATSVGENWAVNSKTDSTNLYNNDSTGNKVRLFPVDSGEDYFAIYKSKKDFVLSFTAPKAGYYDLTANVHLHTKGGYVSIFVNDTYVGRIDNSNISGAEEQKLLSVYLLEGDLANTITMRNTGISTGTNSNAFIEGFDFVGSLSQNRLIGMEATVANNNVYIGRTENITVEGITTDGSVYEFTQAGETVSYTSSDTSVATVSSAGVITALAKGSTTITVSTSETGYTDTIEFYVRDCVFDHFDFNLAEGQSLNVDGTVNLQVTPYMSDGTLVEADDFTVAYTSSDTSVATIESGVLSLIGTGSTTVTASVNFVPTGEVKTLTRTIYVKNIDLTSIEAVTAKPVVQALDTDGVPLVINGFSGDEEIADLSSTGFDIADFTFESLNPEIITVDANGVCTFVSRGVGEVKVSLTSDSTINCTAKVVAGSEKTGRTIFTDEKVAQAQANIANYSWAATLSNNAVKNSNKYTAYLDKLYNLIPAEGVPRSTTISTINATYTLLNCCPYCDANFTAGDAEIKTDPINYPWKIQCSACAKRFPSNDFALLYERGLDTNGNYNVQLAYANNAAAVARGEKDALVNESFSDKGSTWMVDDGFGWSPSAGTYGTKDTNKWAPVAKYHHLVWYNSETYDITKILTYFKNAYMWTGEEAYGRAGAILLDRVADVYPDYDIVKVGLGYSASHGGGYSGKILGSIWEHYLGEIFVECYDAFYPMYDDATVISYLSSKATKLGLDNPKTSAELIRENVENGLVRETRDALLNADICGNFGMQQKVAAKTAVALDVEKESEELLDWVMAPSVITKERVVDSVYGTPYNSRNANSGGELATKYVNGFDRDGFGGEVSLTYNKIWLQKSVEVAEALALYSEEYDLYQNPKFVNIFETFIHMTLGDGYSLAVGDGGSTAHPGVTNFATEMLIGYSHLKDPKLAQVYNYYVGGDLSNKYIDIYSDPTALINSVKTDIATYGEYKFKSLNLTGYGLAVLRGGDNDKDYETRYDTWMYYGRTAESHAHYDMLSTGLSAYGFNFMPDLGYPEDTSKTANRYEWVKNTISHNTVVVDGDHQEGLHTGNPLHFDSTEYVKVVDTEANDAYASTDIYRRTLVSVWANEDVSYTLDFFRIKGGDSHMYSFHTQSYSDYASGDIAFTSDDITFTAQTDSSGNYVGTYAGADVEYGPDPNSTDAVYAEETVYTRGYTWLNEVNRGADKTSDGVFTINFEQTDFRGQVEDSEGLNLKFWALNHWTPDSVDVVTGYPPRKASNAVIPGLHYMFIHRTGSNLDTLYTSLLEPYKGDSYIADAEPLVATVKSGTEGTNDISKVVKVTLKNGRTDYIIYATNNDVTYTVKDGSTSFDFKGFIGVYALDASGNNIYRYVNDGSKIGATTGTGTYTGTIVDFTKDLSFENNITIQLNETISDVSIFEDQYIYVENTTENTGAFRIESAEKSGNYVILHLGNTSVIESYADNYNLDAGFVYTIAEGQNFKIPVSLIDIP